MKTKDEAKDQAKPSDIGKDKILASNNVVTDVPKTQVTLGSRVIYTIIAWLVLYRGITEGNNYLISIVLFAFPLWLDYFNFMPVQTKRRWLRYSQLWISGIVCFVGVLGLANIIAVKSVNGVMWLSVLPDNILPAINLCPLNWIHIAIGVLIIPITIADWIGAERKYYVEINQIMGM